MTEIPKEFTLFGHKITVRMEDINLDENEYGYWSDALNEIVIYKNIREAGNTVALTYEHIMHTFWHELRHAMQWYSVGSYNEQDAQTFASLMMEFSKSSVLNI